MDYAVEKSNGKKIVTNQHVQVMLEGALKDFHFNGISNSPITEVGPCARLLAHSTDVPRPRLQTTRIVWMMRESHYLPNHSLSQSSMT